MLYMKGRRGGEEEGQVMARLVTLPAPEAQVVEYLPRLMKVQGSILGWSICDFSMAVKASLRRGRYNLHFPSPFHFLPLSEIVFLFA